jgi:antitoxin HicB
MAKDLAYYVSLKYRLEVTPIPDEDGGGYYAHYPELGPSVGHGDGDTIEKAIKEANISKKLHFEVCLDYGDPINEPESLKEYSGNLNLRVPKSLHRELAEEAKRDGVSLNQYAVYRLSRLPDEGVR